MWNAFSDLGELLMTVELPMPVASPEMPGMSRIKPFITNTSEWSARNLLVRVDLYGVGGFGAGGTGGAPGW